MLLINNDFALLSDTEATVFPPTAIVAAPEPINTSNFPDVLIEAVHLPTHFNAPVPKEGFAATHLPVREDLDAGIKLLVILNSPLCPLPTQSKTWAVPVNGTPFLTVNSGAFLTDVD